MWNVNHSQKMIKPNISDHRWSAESIRSVSGIAGGDIARAASTSVAQRSANRPSDVSGFAAALAKIVL